MPTSRGVIGDESDAPVSRLRQGFRRTWTGKERKQLKTMLEVDGLSIADAAEALGRGYSVVYQKAVAWGFSFKREKSGRRKDNV